MRKLFLLTISVLLCLGSFKLQAQQDIPKKAKDYHSKALVSYHERAFDKTEEFEKKAIEIAPTWIEPYALLGDMYRSQKMYQQGVDLFKQFQKNNPKHFGGYLNAADFFTLMGKYSEAASELKSMLQLADIPPIRKAYAEKRVKDLSILQNLIDHPVAFKPENVGTGVNTKLNEYLPALTVDNENLFFTRRKVIDSVPSFRESYYSYRYNEDLFVSHLKDGKWETASEIPGKVNTRDNEGGMAIAPDGSFLVFTGCERPDGAGSCDLYIAFFQNGQWTKPVNMGDPINTRYKETQPSISYDGRTIYFTSNRPGSVGGLDIWMTTRDDQWNFGTPVNLGPVINTVEDDQTPFIHPDDQTLYFCSHGHIGFGMNDIFYARRKGDGWDTAVNLGYPINTTGDEIGLVVDREGKYAYYTSDQGATYGQLDIFRFELPQEAKPQFVTYLKGKVFDAYSKKPVDGYFELVDLETGKTVIGTNTTGAEFLAPLPGGKDYMVNVSAKGYLFYSENIPLKEYKSREPYRQDIPLKPIKAGEKIALRNIFFDTDKFTLQEKSKSELQRLAAFLKENPSVKIEISGHTDNSGTPAHNKELSQSRAKAVYDYLVKQGGIEAARLSYKGYGETQPVAPNTTDEGKAQNRRTEVKIIQ